jgi:hypothetical protein
MDERIRAINSHKIRACMIANALWTFADQLKVSLLVNLDHEQSDAIRDTIRETIGILTARCNELSMFIEMSPDHSTTNFSFTG